MHFSRSLRRGVVLVALLALTAPLAAFAGHGKKADDRRRDDGRVFYATDAGNSLLRFRSDEPGRLRARQITGLPVGVSIKGIDFRPASGDLYALGSDKVVYRLNPLTAIAVPEGKSFDQMPSILAGAKNGFDFNPTVDKIRVTSDARENLRLNPDDGTLLSVDTMLTPADVTIVGLGLHELVVHGVRDAADHDRAVRVRRQRDVRPAVDPAPGPKGEFYELWFVGPGDTLARPNRISAGTFHPDEDGRSHVRFAAAVDPAKYPVLSVTAEPGDGNPRRTGPEVLRSRPPAAG